MAVATVPKMLADADLIRRLGQVVHAAFLYAGFVSYGVQPPSGHVLRQTTESGTSLTLCRWYTAPELAHRDDAEAAVLVMCATEGSRHVALVIFLTKARDMKGTYLERLDTATLNFSGRCSKISWSLADGVCRGLLDQLRRRNGLTLQGFRSLPDDAKVEILKRLRSAKDLARVECTCKDLRRLVAARDGELWGHLYWHEAPAVKGRWRPIERTFRFDDLHRYEYDDLYDDMISRIEEPVQVRGWMSMDEFEIALEREHDRARESQWGPFVPVDVKISSEDGVPSWKEKYLLARNRMYAGSRILLPKTTHVMSWRLRQRPRPGDVEEAAGKVSIGQRQKKVPSAYDEKRHGRRGAGTTHTPSYRNHWSHR